MENEIPSFVGMINGTVIQNLSSKAQDKLHLWSEESFAKKGEIPQSCLFRNDKLNCHPERNAEKRRIFQMRVKDSSVVPPSE